MKYFTRRSLFILWCLLSWLNPNAQPGAIDLTFNPSDQGFGFGDGPSSIVNSIAVQSDGKILIGGSFTFYNGFARKQIARLNDDGALDGTFDPGIGANGAVTSIALQSDGKILIIGSFNTYNGVNRNYIARLNANGTLDGSFDPGIGANSGVHSIAVQSDGKILIGGGFTTYNGTTRNRVARLNADGTLDTSFDPGTGAGSTVRSIKVQSDGKILIVGDFTSYNGTSRNRIARLNIDGSLDGTLDPGTGANGSVLSITVQSDGKILIGGGFTSYNGTTRNRIARLNANGTLDGSFDPGTGASNEVRSITVQSDGSILIGGLFTTYNGTTRNSIARLNTNGTLDGSFDAGTGVEGSVNSIALQSDGKILIGGGFTSYKNRMARINFDGTLDVSFNPGSGASHSVRSISVQSDGKILIGGDFTSYNRTARNRIARLNADGSLDVSFNPGTGVEGTGSYINSIAIQSDGKILIGGGFTTYNGTTRNRIARLNADGTLDASFDPGTGVEGTGSYISSIAIQSDGKILIGGFFTTYNGATSNYMARLNTDGRLDSSFIPGTGPEYEVKSIVIQSDSKILIGGTFTTYNGTTRNYIARLNANGTLDGSFNPGTGANGDVFSIMIQSDGKILIGGFFTSYNGTTRNSIARLNVNGTLDGSFDPGTGTNFLVSSIAVQSDGKILIGGWFTTYNDIGRNNIARLNADGTLDGSFDPGTGADNTVYFVKVQSDGKILIGGEFTSYNGTGRNRVARILNPCSNPSSGGTIAAAQSGSSPFDPAAFTSSAAASGHSGTLEYKWQSSTTSSSAGFSDIASSDAATYNAGSLTQTTWYKRLARVSCQSDWTGAAESNVLEVTVHSSFTWNGSTSTDWNTASNWTPAYVPSTGAAVTIPSGLTNYPVTPSAVSMISLNVSAGSYDLGASVVTLTGSLTNNGTITGTGKVVMGGSAAQTISGTGTIRNLEINNSAGVTISGWMQRVTGTLTLTSGTLAVGGTTSPYTAGRLTLASSATGTSRIPAHTNGGSGTGSVTGHVIVERYFSVDGRNKQWRGLGFPFAADMEVSAVGGIAVDFNSGTRSMMYYNEQSDNGSYGNTGTRNAGYQSFTAASEALTAGKGAMAWIYGNASTVGPANGTGNMSGSVTVTSFGVLNENGTAVSMPVTYNSTPVDPNHRGWNLLSNPYASSIDWSHGDIIKTNIDNAIYRWDPAAANWTSWSAGTGTPDASITAIIESGNSFFVKANAASPVLTIPQTAKTETAPGFVHFGRAPRLNLPGERAPRTYTFAGIRLLVKGQGNPLPDGAYVDVSRPEASAQFDGALDAESMGRSSGAGIAVKDKSGKAYAIQFDRPILQVGTEKRYYPLRLTTPVPGSTTLTLQTEGNWNPSNSVALLDNKEGKTYLMKGGQLEHSFTLNELKSEGRFVLAINHVKLSADGQLPAFEVKALGNPVTSHVIELLISHPSATAKHWRVVDAAGREVGNGSFQADAGLQHRLTVPDMRSSGAYVVQVEMDNGETQQVRILKN